MAQNCNFLQHHSEIESGLTYFVELLMFADHASATAATGMAAMAGIIEYWFLHFQNKTLW